MWNRVRRRAVHRVRARIRECPMSPSTRSKEKAPMNREGGERSPAEKSRSSSSESTLVMATRSSHRSLPIPSCWPKYSSTSESSSSISRRVLPLLSKHITMRSIHLVLLRIKCRVFRSSVSRCSGGKRVSRKPGVSMMQMGSAGRFVTSMADSSSLLDHDSPSS
jgi:hypothetical protein